MPNILNGNSSTNVFVLGENGICFGSNDPERDEYWFGEELGDTVITNFDPKEDSIRLAGTREDYLLRPTSLPFEIQGYLAGTVALGIFLTDRNRRYILEGGFTGRGNEITSVAWILPSPANKLSFNLWLDQAGLALDPSVNSPINNYAGGSTGNYFYDPSGRLLLFEGGLPPIQSADAGYMQDSRSTQPSSGSDTSSSVFTTKEGADSLTGNPKQKDTFLFESKPEYGPSIDKIINFSLKDKDTIQFSEAAFGISSGTFSLAKKPKKLAKNLATDVDIIYNQAKGELIFNANGPEAGFGTDGGVFAQLVGAPKLTGGSVSFV